MKNKFSYLASFRNFIILYSKSNVCVCVCVFKQCLNVWPEVYQHRHSNSTSTTSTINSHSVWFYYFYYFDSVCCCYLDKKKQHKTTSKLTRNRTEPNIILGQKLINLFIYFYMNSKWNNEQIWFFSNKK